MEDNSDEHIIVNSCDVPYIRVQRGKINKMMVINM